MILAGAPKTKIIWLRPMWSLSSDSLGAVTSSLENQFQGPTMLFEEPFPNILFENAHAASHHFHVSCHHPTEMRTTAPRGSCGLWWSHLSAFSSKCNKPSDLSYFSKVFTLRPFTISVALWAHPESFLFLLYWDWCHRSAVFWSTSPCLGHAGLPSWVSWVTMKGVIKGFYFISICWEWGQ